MDAASRVDGKADTGDRSRPQRRRLIALLGKALPQGELERLLLQGRGLSLFEADHLAGFSGTERPRLKV